MEFLTLRIAKELKGKKIRYGAPAYWCNYPPRGVMVIGELISEWDYHKAEPCQGFESRTAYWESYMRPEQIEELKKTILLLDGDGKWEHPFIRCHLIDTPFDEPTFTIGDADRAVSFEVIEDK